MGRYVQGKGQETDFMTRRESIHGGSGAASLPRHGHEIRFLPLSSHILQYSTNPFSDIFWNYRN